MKTKDIIITVISGILAFVCLVFFATSLAMTNHSGCNELILLEGNHPTNIKIEAAKNCIKYLDNAEYKDNPECVKIKNMMTHIYLSDKNIELNDLSISWRENIALLEHPNMMRYFPLLFVLFILTLGNFLFQMVSRCP